MKIKEMLEIEKPRERLNNYGVESLSNEELLAIILKCGTKNINSKELSMIILKELGGVEYLKDASINLLSKIKGIGNVKACQIQAAVELGKRVHYVKDKEKLKVNSTIDTYNIYRSEFDNLKQEKFCALYLDTKKNVIKFITLFKGTIDKSVIHPREIFKEALLTSASSVIVMHNHPSGDASPSIQDIDITEILIKTGDVMGIKLIDHIIFGNNTYYSFYETMNKNK